MELLPECIRQFIQILQPNSEVKKSIMENMAVKVILKGSENITADSKATFIAKDAGDETDN